MLIAFVLASIDQLFCSYHFPTAEIRAPKQTLPYTDWLSFLTSAILCILIGQISNNKDLGGNLHVARPVRMCCYRRLKILLLFLNCNQYCTLKLTCSIKTKRDIFHTEELKDFKLLGSTQTFVFAIFPYKHYNMIHE